MNLQAKIQTRAIVLDTLLDGSEVLALYGGHIKKGWSASNSRNSNHEDQTKRLRVYKKSSNLESDWEYLA